MGMPIRNSLALMGKKKTNQPKKLISLKLIGSYVPRNADSKSEYVYILN